VLVCDKIAVSPRKRNNDTPWVDAVFVSTQYIRRFRVDSRVPTLAE